jgi:UDP-N-acetylmuramoyl-tripeptide--D-alanyl-D-alanine ligase
MTLAWVADAVGATRPADSADSVVGEVVTDSRTIRPGDLFVALRGPRFDGHAFVADVLNRGAVAAIVERGRVQDDGRTIAVPDTLEALQRLALEVRRSVGSRVFAITGSAGKTTT